MAGCMMRAYLQRLCLSENNESRKGVYVCGVIKIHLSGDTLWSVMFLLLSLKKVGGASLIQGKSVLRRL